MVVGTSPALRLRITIPDFCAVYLEVCDFVQDLNLPNSTDLDPVLAETSDYLL